MKKDIFIDNNIATRFSNPQDKEYIKLTKWLMDFDPNDKDNIDEYAHLVVSQKLLVEYCRSAYNCANDSSIPSIIDKLTRENRLVKITKQQITDFKATNFKSAVIKKLKSNAEDQDLIPVVLLSDRKFALTYDKNFTDDLENFPGYKATVKKRPEDLPYK